MKWLQDSSACRRSGMFRRSQCPPGVRHMDSSFQVSAFFAVCGSLPDIRPGWFLLAQSCVILTWLLLPHAIMWPEDLPLPPWGWGRLLKEQELLLWILPSLPVSHFLACKIRCGWQQALSESCQLQESKGFSYYQSLL